MLDKFSLLQLFKYIPILYEMFDHFGYLLRMRWKEVSQYYDNISRGEKKLYT